MGSFKFNPFTASFDIVEDNISRSNSVWVDNQKGNDSIALVERVDRPFKTINAAMNAILALSENNWNVFIAEGTYSFTQVTIPTSVLVVGTRNITFKGLSRKSTTLDSSTSNLFIVTATNTTNIFLEDIRFSHGGGTGFVGTGTTNYFAKNCDFVAVSQFDYFSDYTLRTATDCIFNLGTARLMELAPQFASNPNPRRSTFYRCYITGTGSVFTKSGVNTHELINVTFIDCDIICSNIHVTNGKAEQVYFKDCRIVGTSNPILSHGGSNISFLGKCEIQNNTATSGSLLNINNTTDDLNLVIFDNVALKQERTNTSPCISTTGNESKVDLLVLNKLFCTVPPVSTVYGGIGASFPGGITIGNTITFDLPSPLNTDPVVYVVATTNLNNELLAMKALIDAKVSTPGNVWNTFTDGDTNNVVVGASDISIFTAPSTPQGFVIGTATAYITETGTDITTSNTNYAGVTNQGAGDIDVLPNTTYLLGGVSDLRIIDRISQVPSKLNN